MTGKRIAILGAGIMGASLAIFLARRGAEVTLFDAHSRPVEAASRWNEGKIHLGYLYSADSGLATARHVLPGGLRFRPLMEALLGGSIAPAISARDDLFLCHRQSVVSPDAMERYFAAVTDLLRNHRDAQHYLADASCATARRLTPRELADVADPALIQAGFRVPERSVNTRWIAERLAAAVMAEPGITWRGDSSVTAVRGMAGTSWQVVTADGIEGPFDLVINALWQGRMAIDATAGIQPSGTWSNRYRLSLFVRTRKALDLPCAMIATGPFGDVKNYDGRNFYLSWYPAGLRVESGALVPPTPAVLDPAARTRLTDETFERLGAHLPWIADIRTHAEEVRPAGGWVFARGRGALSDPASALHRRSEFGELREGSYLSIDTGKYSTAPWLAQRLAEELG